ncbi:MAG: hypothetical protein JNJ59_23525 [Deltaproteobacteria bacterium]|nr:hypothetical protein [Deltaproteobacteria bacterium]
MLQLKTLIVALGLTFSSGAFLAGAASAAPGDRPDRGWGDRRDHDDNDNDQYGRQNEYDQGYKGDRGNRWDRGPRAVPAFTSVKFVNERNEWVTLFLNGRYIGKIAPNSRERIDVPIGSHTVTYKVGFRNRFHNVAVDAFPGRGNRVVIEGRRGWGGGWGGGW